MVHAGTRYRIDVHRDRTDHDDNIQNTLNTRKPQARPWKKGRSYSGR